MKQEFIAGTLAFTIGLILFLMPLLIKWLFPKWVKNYFCPACGGDGIETCNNPDHGFIHGGWGGSDLARIGCPCCGHDENHKIRGSSCFECNGLGLVSKPEAERILDDWRIDEHQQIYKWY